jgi:hypothetical protein
VSQGDKTLLEVKSKCSIGCRSPKLPEFSAKRRLHFLCAVVRENTVFTVQAALRWLPSRGAIITPREVRKRRNRRRWIRGDGQLFFAGGNKTRQIQRKSG